MFIQKALGSPVKCVTLGPVGRPRAAPPLPEGRRGGDFPHGRESRGSFLACDGGVGKLRTPGSHLHQRGRGAWVSWNFRPPATEGLKNLREGNNFKFHTQLKMRLIQNYSVRSFLQQNKVVSTSSPCPGSLCAKRVGPSSTQIWKR